MHDREYYLQEIQNVFTEKVRKYDRFNIKKCASTVKNTFHVKTYITLKKEIVDSLCELNNPLRHADILKLKKILDDRRSDIDRIRIEESKEGEFNDLIKELKEKLDDYDLFIDEENEFERLQKENSELRQQLVQSQSQTECLQEQNNNLGQQIAQQREVIGELRDLWGKVRWIINYLLQELPANPLNVVQNVFIDALLNSPVAPAPESHALNTSQANPVPNVTNNPNTAPVVQNRTSAAAQYRD